MSKKIIIIILTIIIITIVSCSEKTTKIPAGFESGFIFKNRTNETIGYIYVRSSSYPKRWEESTYINLKKGKDIYVGIKQPTLFPNDMYDIQLISENYLYTKKNVHIPKNSSVSFNMNDRNPIVTIINDTGYNFEYTEIHHYNPLYEDPFIIFGKESFQIIYQSIDDRYDIRLFRDVLSGMSFNNHEYSFTKYNVLIKNDVTLVFNELDKDPSIIFRTESGTKITQVTIKNSGDLITEGYTLYSLITLDGTSIVKTLPTILLNPENTNYIYDFHAKAIHQGFSYTKLGIDIYDGIEVIFTDEDQDPIPYSFFLVNSTTHNNCILNIINLENLNITYYSFSRGETREIVMVNPTSDYIYDLRLRTTTSSPQITFYKKDITIMQDDIIIFTEDDYE